MDLRRRVLRTWQEESLTNQEIADRFGIGVATVVRWKRLFRETGSVAPRPHGGGQPRKIPPDKEGLLEALVKAHPDWTEREYADALFDQQGIEAAASTVGKVIRSMGYTVKKRPSVPANEIGPASDGADKSTSESSEASPLRVWFSWTRPE